ncbi:uncharacterized protein [Palaemon carinicauda]|uniref:uncharacterized protein n=1 Tax=Palaemon carinicauda TaxID=392227 RepID=UPI0035B6AA84
MESIFTNDKGRLFRLLHMICHDGRNVLYSVFRWGTPDKDLDMPLDVFLTDKLGYGRKKVRTSFSVDQKKLIDQNPSCDLFDTTLLVIATNMGCKGLRTAYPGVLSSTVETNLRLHINKIREFRNSLAHLYPITVEDQLFNERTEELRELLKETLQVAAQCYGIDDLELKEQIKILNDAINRSRDDDIEKQDILTYENSIYLQSRQNILRNEGKDQLLDKYKVFDHISPVLFFTQKNLHLEVGLIFTYMEVVESGSGDSQEVIEYEDLLEFAQKRTIDNKSQTDILFIEGIAGAGKTTLTRIITCEWRNQQSPMQCLLEYDLLIYFECRNSAIHSLEQLLETLMSNVLPKFKEGDLMKCIRTLKLLIIADGLDELNQSSTKVFREILDLGTYAAITMICTSRPEFIKTFYSLVPQGQYVTHLRIKGVPREKRNDFVVRYHEELKRIGITQKEIDGLITFMENSSNYLEEPLRLPLNLAWLTIMWSLSPERLNNVTGATELYTEILDMNKERLIQKLKMTETTKYDSNLARDLDRFLLYLSREALISLKEETIDSLPEDSVERLKDACASLELPYEPILSAFLIETILYNTSRTKSVFSIAHKGELDYLAANYVIEALRGNDLRFDITSIIRNIQIHPSYQNSSLRAEFIQNILRRLTATPTSAAIEIINRTEESEVLVYNENSTEIISIRTVFEELYGIGRVPSDLSCYQNMFLYTAGLLHRVPLTMRKTIADELVCLFQQSGVPNKDQWYDLLMETKLNETVAESIASRVSGFGKGTANITDRRSLNAYSVLVPHGKYNVIKLNIPDRVDDIQNLDKFIANVTEKQECPLVILLHYYFRNPDAMSPELDIKLRRLFERGNIQKFMGWLSEETSKLLPPTIVNLWLQLDAKNARPIIEALSHLKDRAKEFRYLGVHVVPGVDPSILATLPGEVDLILFLSGVDDENADWACRVAKNLQPASGRKAFSNILIPLSQLTPDGLCQLVSQMKLLEVCIVENPLNDLAVYSDRIFEQDRERLRAFTRESLKWPLRFADNKDTLWPKIIIK